MRGLVTRSSLYQGLVAGCLGPPLASPKVVLTIGHVMLVSEWLREIDDLKRGGVSYVELLIVCETFTNSRRRVENSFWTCD